MNQETYDDLKTQRLYDAAVERERREKYRAKHTDLGAAGTVPPLATTGDAKGTEVQPAPNRARKRTWGVRRGNKHGYKHREKLRMYGATHWLPQAIQTRKQMNTLKAAAATEGNE